MPTDITMPQLGYEMTHGTVARWLKHEGDAVQAGDVIAEIETDKAIVELEADDAGVLIDCLAAEGETVPVGALLAILGTAAEAGQTPRPDRRREAIAKRQPSAVRAPGSPPVPQSMRGGYPPRVPGPDGKIMLGRMGEAIARRTQATAVEAPHFYLTARVDMTDAAAYRREMNRRNAAEDRVSINDMILKACALALLKNPVYNSTFEGDHLAVQPHVNVGIAVALPDGLVVPAVVECERKSLVEIARDARDLASRVREGTLHQAEYTGTFTVSNLGMFSVDSFTAIIVSPQVGVLAVGSMEATPIVRGGEVVARQMMSITLSTDHRAASGAEAAQFAGEVKRLLEEPALLEGS